MVAVDSKSNSSSNNDEDGSWEKYTPKGGGGRAAAGGSSSQRLYIGNLPTMTASKRLETELLTLLLQQQPTESESSITTRDVQVICRKSNSDSGKGSTAASSHAFVTCPSRQVADSLIAALHGVEFQGRSLVVQQADEKQSKKKKSQNPRYAKQKGKGRNGFGQQSSSNPFGTRSWSKPSSSSSSSSTPATQHEVEQKQQPQTQQQQQSSAPPPSSLQEASERIESIVSEEMKKDNVQEDPLTAMIATTAAVSLVASNRFGMPQSDQEEEEENPEASTAPISFMDRVRQKSMNTLMEDYGEFDPSWKDQPVPEPTAVSQACAAPTAVENNSTTATTSEPAAASTTTTTISRLGQHGKAPIHVELTSFGFKYGAPAASKQGWSHAQPLALFDCRDILANVPPYMAWRDGLSGTVKRALLYADKNNNNDSDERQSISDYTKDIANEVSNALLEAMNEGGFGYAMPLQMHIYVGSELGRHRSVVACELAATALRKLLRANHNDCYSQPCSVGTRHLHLEKSAAAARNSKKKSRDDDDYDNDKLK